MLRVAMCSAASAMSIFGPIVSRSRRVMPWATLTLCGSPPAATRFTMSRSVTMPPSFLPSSTTTDEMPFVRMSLGDVGERVLGVGRLHVGVHDVRDLHRRCLLMG